MWSNDSSARLRIPTITSLAWLARMSTSSASGSTVCSLHSRILTVRSPWNVWISDQESTSAEAMARTRRLARSPWNGIEPLARFPPTARAPYVQPEIVLRGIWLTRDFPPMISLR